MYEVKVLTEFAASHHLREYDGTCERRHGHNWKVEVICGSETLDSIGLVIDFRVLKEKVNVILDELDHYDLNECAYFKDVNPSSENIAYYIFSKLRDDASLTEKVRVLRVNVWENDRSCASYYES